MAFFCNIRYLYRSDPEANAKGLLADLTRRAKPGHAVILMGACDPTLSLLAQEIKNSS